MNRKLDTRSGRLTELYFLYIVYDVKHRESSDCQVLPPRGNYRLKQEEKRKKKNNVVS